MFETRKKYLVGLALVVGAGAAGVVYSGGTGMNKDAFKAAQQRIEAEAQVQREACGRFKGSAKDLCEVQAKGSQKVAKAQLQAQYKPGPEAEKLVKFAQADADFELAKQRCQPLKDSARDRCVARAKHDREAAVRLAKVEKVQEVRARERELAQERKARQKTAAVAQHDS